MARTSRISREKVATVALRLLDDEGINAVTLERIANELSVRAPSLYHYYDDKSAILDDVAAMVLGDLARDRRTDDWVEWLVGNAVDFYVRVMQHPNAAVLLIEHLSPAAVVAGFGHGARLLARAGVEPSLQQALLEGVQHIAWGFTLQRTAMAANGYLYRSPDPDRWPDLVRARQAVPWDDVMLLEHTVRAFIAGMLAIGAPEADGRRPLELAALCANSEED